jgi:HTH-type transcriptional regulator/antitoxin HipB
MWRAWRRFDRYFSCTGICVLHSTPEAVVFPLGNVEKLMKKTVENVAEIGTLVKQQRKKLRLKQAEAAGLVGVGVRFFSELERGKETLAMGKVLHVLRSLGLHFSVSTAMDNNSHDK